MRAIGLAVTSATTEVPLNGTAYVEPAAPGLQRSIQSSSAADTAAGTGARKVRVTYFTDGGAGIVKGPFVEVVTLNGVTAVPTVALNIAYIEKLEVITAGSGGVAVGVVSLYTDNAGAGSVIASIAAGNVRTYNAIHYVATGKRCRIVDVEVFGGDAAAALTRLMVQSYPAGIGSVEMPITGSYGTTSALPRGIMFPDSSNVVIPGPARIRLLVAPGNVNTQTTRASFGFVDETSSP